MSLSFQPLQTRLTAETPSRWRRCTWTSGSSCSSSPGSSRPPPRPYAVSARWPRSSQVTRFGPLWSRALHAVSAVWPSGVWVPRPALRARCADGGKGRACPQVGRGEGRARVQGGDVCGGPDCAPPQESWVTRCCTSTCSTRTCLCSTSSPPCPSRARRGPRHGRPGRRRCVHRRPCAPHRSVRFPGFYL